ncbi:MAG: ABC transporter permease, partial [Alphaproteobacteria bacterium]
MLVTALDKKLFRDLMHMRGQAIAIALVIAAGVATLILATGAYSSLDETRRTYYERYRFADIFAQARRAPDYLKEKLSQIPGVSVVETRIVFPVLLDIEGMNAPASGQLISLPRYGAPVLNGLFLRSGRMPDPNRDDEIIVNEPFAKANHFQPGSKLKAILNGRKRELTIVGVALSPEFIYALAPGELVPDDKRFGVLWIPHEAAAGAFDLDGAFNDVSLKLRRDAVAAEVMERVDTLLEPFGCTDAYARKDQQSYAFLNTELTQLEAMAYVIPPIFLAVAAFLLNMTLARIIALEREQIGLLKALGYKRVTIAMHYIKFAGLIAVVGILIGFAGGTWLGRGLTRLYAEFYHFPFLVYLYSFKVYLAAGGISMAAALIGALRAVRDAVNLPPAVAMAAPVPVRYKQTWLSHFALIKRLSQTTRMILRHLIRYPLQSLLTTMGIASSVALLVSSLFTLDSIDFMVDVTYFRTMRQDVSVTFNEIKSLKVVQEMQRLPGVLNAEA